MATTEVYAWKPVGANQHLGSAVPAEAPKTTKELAAIAGVGVRSIEQAKAVHSKAVPEVIAAAKQGVIGTEKAAAIAKLPQAEQAAAIHKPAPKPAKPAPPPAPVVEPEAEAPPEYTALDMVAHQVLSAYHVTRKRAAMQAGPPPAQCQYPPHQQHQQQPHQRPRDEAWQARTPRPPEQGDSALDF